MPTKTKTKTRAPSASPKMPGPKSVLRGKVRSPLSVLATPAGHVSLRAELERTGLSVSDYLETLWRTHGHRITQRDTERLPEATS